jgi:hypothetical protein
VSIEDGDSNEQRTAGAGWRWDGTQWIQDDIDLSVTRVSVAEVAGRTSLTTDSFVADRTLREVYGFAPSDLSANRDGRMTKRQRALLTVSAVAFLLPAAVLTPIAVMLAVGADELGPVVASTATVLAALYLAWRSFSFTADAVHGRVSVVSGAVDKTIERNYRFYQYYVRIGELKTQVSGDDYAKLESGAGLRAYYAPAASRLLSAEPESEPEATPSRAYGPHTARDIARGRQVIAWLTAGAVLLALLGARLFFGAQPATFTGVAGPVWDFQAKPFRKASNQYDYYVWLDDNPNGYQLRTAPDGFTPHLPDLNRDYGMPAVLYINDQDGKVAAIWIDRMYTTDLFRDPTIQERTMRAHGSAAWFFALVMLLPLLVSMAVQLILKLPSSKDVRPADVRALERPEVKALIQRINRLSSHDWDRAQLVEPLGGNRGQGPLTRGKWQAIGQAFATLEDKTRMETILGHRAVGAIAFRQELADRDFVAMYGPLVHIIPLDSIGVQWSMSDLVDTGACEVLVDKFRAATTPDRLKEQFRVPHLPDSRQRIEAAICLAALDATAEQKESLAGDLVELAGLQIGGKEAKVAQLVWLGESPEAARQVVYRTEYVISDLVRRHSEQSFVTGLGCYASVVLLIFGGIYAAYMWITVGDSWGGWIALGLAAAATPFVGAIFFYIVSRFLADRVAFALAVAITVGTPAAILIGGWTQLRNPWLIAVISLASPTITILFAWLQLRKRPPSTAGAVS